MERKVDLDEIRRLEKIAHQRFRASFDVLSERRAPVPVESYAQYHLHETSRVANEAFDTLMSAFQAGGYPELYCYFTARLRQLHVAEEKPHDDSELAWGERVPGNLTREQLHYWFAKRTGSVPYLATEGTMQDKIIEKVRRLLALAESDNVNEAANAAAAAQRLMVEHRIDTAALAVESGEEDEPIENDTLFSAAKKETWLGILASGVAASNGAECYWKKTYEGSFLHIVGTTDMVKTTRYMFEHLRREIDRLCKAAGSGKGRGFQNSFRLGAASTLSFRVRSAAKEQRREQRTVAASKGSSALVRIDNALARMDLDKLRVRGALPSTLRKAKAVRASDACGYEEGQRAAAQVEVELGRGGPALGSGSAGNLQRG